MQLTKYEQETIINYNQEEGTASIYTHDTRLINKLVKYCRKHPESFKCIGEEGQAKNFTIDKELICIRTPIAKKELSEQERAVIRERLLKSRGK